MWNGVNCEPFPSVSAGLMPPLPHCFLLINSCMSQIDTVCIKVPGLHEYTHMDGHKAHCLMRCWLQCENQNIWLLFGQVLLNQPLSMRALWPWVYWPLFKIGRQCMIQVLKVVCHYYVLVWCLPSGERAAIQPLGGRRPCCGRKPHRWSHSAGKPHW